jgi:hypothetical protein
MTRGAPKIWRKIITPQHLQQLVEHSERINWAFVPDSLSQISFLHLPKFINVRSLPVAYDLAH